jgi:hypothetical protein
LNDSPLCNWLDPLLQRRKQLVRINGLGDVVVHSCLKALLFIAGHGMGRHRDNRYWILEDESSSESLSLSFELSALFPHSSSSILQLI